MQEIKTEIEINATPEQVWQVLTNFESYADWNPYIVRASGKAAGGEHLKLTLRQPDGKEKELKAIVTKVMQSQELRWQGFKYLGGLDDFEHIISIEELEPGRVKLVQRDQSSGLVVPFRSDSARESIQAGYQAMNKALKERLEKKPW